MALPAIIAATALAAAYRFGLFRESEPHLNITQDIHCQPLGDSYRLVAVKSVLHNNSKVLVRPYWAECQLQQTSPMDDGTVEAIYQERVRQQHTSVDDYAWWNLDPPVIKTWSQGELTIEPDERHPVTFEFIVAKATSGIRIVTTVLKEQSGSASMAYDYLDIDEVTTGGAPNEKPEQTGY